MIALAALVMIVAKRDSQEVTTALTSPSRKTGMMNTSRGITYNAAKISQGIEIFFLMFLHTFPVR